MTAALFAHFHLKLKVSKNWSKRSPILVPDSTLQD